MNNKPEHGFSLLNIFANRPLADLAFRHLRANALPDTMCRMPLLARRLPIGLQNIINESRYRGYLPTWAFGLLSWPW